MLVEFIRWAGVVVGVTYAVTQASIFAHARIAFVRWWRTRDAEVRADRIKAAARAAAARGEREIRSRDIPHTNMALWAETFIYCPTCVGFWVAFFVGLGGRVWPWGDDGDVALVHAIDSGLCSVLVTTLWNAAQGGNPAHAIEHPALHPEERDDDAQETQTPQE